MFLGCRSMCPLDMIVWVTLHLMYVTIGTTYCDYQIAYSQKLTVDCRHDGVPMSPQFSRTGMHQTVSNWCASVIPWSANKNESGRMNVTFFTVNQFWK